MNKMDCDVSVNKIATKKKKKTIKMEMIKLMLIYHMINRLVAYCDRLIHNQYCYRNIQQHFQVHLLLILCSLTYIYWISEIIITR